MLVIVHNAMALLIGNLAARTTGLSEFDRRSITIETGIQNSGLGLILIFAFFNGLGGMAVVAAFWGYLACDQRSGPGASDVTHARCRKAAGCLRRAGRMKRLLITGAAGHVGQALLAQPGVDRFAVTACDIQPFANLSDKVEFQRMDVCDREAVSRIIETSRPDVVIHLASIVTPPKGSGRDFAYDVDVNGTRHVVDACLEHGVGRLAVTSSGAAYGYHPENASMLKEEDPIRGNREFAYSYHKRLVEEMLAETRQGSPGTGAGYIAGGDDPWRWSGKPDHRPVSQEPFAWTSKQ